MSHLKQDEIANLVRRKVGIQPISASESKPATFFSREEQLVILAHLIKQEEIIKEAKVTSEMVQSITDRVLHNLKVETDEQRK